MGSIAGDMKTALALLLFAVALPASAGEKCETFIVPSVSRYAGDHMRLLPEGKIEYNGEVSQKLFATRCSDNFSICLYEGRLWC